MGNRYYVRTSNSERYKKFWKELEKLGREDLSLKCTRGTWATGMEKNPLLRQEIVIHKVDS